MPVVRAGGIAEGEKGKKNGGTPPAFYFSRFIPLPSPHPQLRLQSMSNEDNNPKTQPFQSLILSVTISQVTWKA